MNEYQEKCLAIAELYKKASETNRFFQYLCDDGVWRTGKVPIIEEHNIGRFRIEEKYSLDKYIELGLDMEFWYNDDDNVPYFNKLIYIKDEIYTDINKQNWINCRLRGDHIHWWGRDSKINPIPDGCIFRLYDQLGIQNWEESAISDDVDWLYVLAFEIRYKV